MLTLSLLYLFLIAPNWHRRHLSFMTNHRYAHRGYFDPGEGVLENTLPAFQRAVDNHYGIELDVQLTQDNIPVVSHDESLLRVFGIDRLIPMTPYSDIAFLPTLEQVLDLVDGSVPVIIELKSYNRIELLCQSVYSLIKHKSQCVAIESFDPRIVRWFRIHAKEIIRGQLAFGGKVRGFKQRAGKYLLANALTRPDFIAYRVGTERNLSMYLMRQLFKPLLIAWTVRTTSEQALAQKHYDLQIFEHFIESN